MKTKSCIFIALLFFSTNFIMFGQSGMTIRGGGAVTVGGDLIIAPAPFVCGTPMTDTRDGKTYSTVMIGTQCWFAQNLNVGTKVPSSAGQTEDGVFEKYCYNDDDANCAVYGGLYQWDEAMLYTLTPGAQGICPAGWHLPTDAEWTTLTTFLGGEAVAGGKLKEAGTTHWLSPNTGATNETGFTALPGGIRNGTAPYFDGLGYYGFWWSSNVYNTYTAWYRYMSTSVADISRGYLGYRDLGYAVRCLKD